MNPVKAGKCFHGVFLFGGDQTDNGDRLVQVNYPDGTFEQYTYTKLDMTSFLQSAYLDNVQGIAYPLKET